MAAKFKHGLHDAPELETTLSPRPMAEGSLDTTKGLQEDPHTTYTPIPNQPPQIKKKPRRFNIAACE